MRSSHEIQLLCVCSLLRGVAAGILAPAQMAAGAKRLAPRRRLLLLRVLEPQVPLAAHPLDARRLCLRPLARASQQPTRPAHHPRTEHGAQPGNARVLQVFQFLRREPAHFAAERGCVHPDQAPGDRAADRHLVLHVPVDELRHRRLPPRDRAHPQHRPVRGVRLIFPASGRRPDHACLVALAADRHQKTV